MTSEAQQRLQRGYAMRGGPAEHRSSKGPAATVQVYLLERALDGSETP